jgi:hypothetical protein
MFMAKTPLVKNPVTSKFAFKAFKNKKICNTEPSRKFYGIQQVFTQSKPPSFIFYTQPVNTFIEIFAYITVYPS